MVETLKNDNLNQMLDLKTQVQNNFKVIQSEFKESCEEFEGSFQSVMKEIQRMKTSV